jgi:hypothetical protein
MPNKQIFFDPHRKRWKRLRRILDVTAVLVTLVMAAFIFNVLRNQHLPELLLPTPKHNYKALNDRTPLLRGAKARPARRKTTRKPSDIPFNTGEGLRAAYYVQDDAASYSSFKEHVHQLDLLFPQWLHVDAPRQPCWPSITTAIASIRWSMAPPSTTPTTATESNTSSKRPKKILKSFPTSTTTTPTPRAWDPATAPFSPTPASAPSCAGRFFAFSRHIPVYRGLSLDLESLPENSTPAYMSFIQELYADLHTRNLRLYVNTPVSTPTPTLARIAANSDGMILMNYDQHQTTSDPGPIASQDWFVGNLRRALKVVPKEKLICAIGNYGYDWTSRFPIPKDRRHPKPKVVNTEDLHVSDAWQRASDADADLNLDYDSLNPHFDYIDEDLNQRHVVWFLDGVTVLNEMRAARQLGLQTFALWRLGEEDGSLWSIWDKPSNPDSLQALSSVQPGHDVDTEGEGDILSITGLPQPGKRTCTSRYRRDRPPQEAHHR